MLRAALRCAVLCCSVLRCSVLCFSVLHCADQPGVAAPGRFVFKMPLVERIATGVMSSQKSAPVAVTGARGNPFAGTGRPAACALPAVTSCLAGTHRRRLHHRAEYSGDSPALLGSACHLS